MGELIDFKYRDVGKSHLDEKKHTHGNCYEILQVISGEGNFMIGNCIYPLISGAVYFVNGIDYHSSYPRDPQVYIRNKIVISADFVNKVAEITDSQYLIDELFLREGRQPAQLSDEEFAYVEQEMCQIKNVLKEDCVDTKLQIIIAIFRICSRVYAKQDSFIEPIHEHINRTLKFINDNIQNQMSLIEICQQVHISKYYLCHIFKETTGMTVMQYILQRRLAIAKRKLLYTDMSLSEIALSTGFGSFSYFSMLFKKMEGMQPSEYRRRNK